MITFKNLDHVCLLLAPKDSNEALTIAQRVHDLPGTIIDTHYLGFEGTVKELDLMHPTLLNVEIESIIPIVSPTAPNFINDLSEPIKIFVKETLQHYPMPSLDLLFAESEHKASNHKNTAQIFKTRSLQEIADEAAKSYSLPATLA